LSIDRAASGTLSGEEIRLHDCQSDVVPADVICFFVVATGITDAQRRTYPQKYARQVRRFQLHLMEGF